MKNESSEDLSFSYQMPNLDIPAPPQDLSYVDFEDYRYREILLANGIEPSVEKLSKTITEKSDILQAAAVHTLGNLKDSSKNEAVVVRLKALLTDANDLVQVEAAYALFRLGFAEANATLLHCLEYPLDAYTAPALAAGYLAKTGDPRGYMVIKKALGSKLSLARVSACKQIYFFVSFNGAADTRGNIVDTTALFEKALKDPDTNVQWQALVQLREVTAPEYKALLQMYVKRVKDTVLRKEAERILAG